MPDFDTSRKSELIWIGVIALAVAVGGRSLLYSLSHNGWIAGVWIGAIALLLLTGIRRRRSQGATPITLTRDVAFIAAALLCIIYITNPARWSSGATIAALEFALVLEMLSILLPGDRDTLPPRPHEQA